MKSRTLTLLVCLALSVVFARNAEGDIFSWDADGNAANGTQDGIGTWSTTNLNWFLNTGTADIGWTNSLTDIATFGVSGGAGGTIALAESLSAGGIQFNGSDPASFSFTGTQSLTIGASGITLQSGAGAESFAAGISATLSGSQSWTNSSADGLTINGSITGSSAANTTLTLLGTGAMNLAAISDGVGKQLALVRGGSGTVNLTAASCYTGGTTLTSGSIVAKSSQALGSTASLLALNGGSLDLAIDSSIAAYNTTVGGSMTVFADLAASGAGITHTLGTLSIGANTLTVKAGANVATGTAGLAFGNLTPTGNPTFDVQNNVSGVLTQLTMGAANFGDANRTLTKSGAGTLLIGGPATGVASAQGLDQTINAGTLQFSASHGWDGGASPSTADGQLILSPIAANTANYQSPNLDQRVTTVKFTGAANTTTAIALGSTGTLTVRSGSNSAVYDATSNPGTATVSGGNSSKFLFAASNSAFVIGDSSNTTSELVMAAPVYATNLTKSGAGTLVFQAANAITGNVTVSAGILRLDGGSTFPSRMTLSGGIVELGSGQTTFTHSAGTSSNQVDINSGTTGFGNNNSIAANINLDTSLNTGPLWDAPGFTAATFQLGTSASLAPLNLVGGINVGSTTTHAIQVDRGNFTLTPANYYDAQIQQSTSTMLGTGTLAKQGSGVLSIIGSPSSTNTTSLNVNAGTVLLANTSGNAWGTGPIVVAPSATIGGAGMTGGALTTSSGGHIAPGNGVNGGGLLTFGGTLTINNGTVLDYDLNAPGAATGTNGNDGLKTTGSIAIFGTGLTLNISPGASFGNGTYHLVQFAGVGPGAGPLTNFTTVNGPNKNYSFASNGLGGVVDLTVGALTQYWDLNGATAGAGGSTPSGNWDSATSNWSTNPAGTAATATWGSANDAVFSAGSDATGSYTITLIGTQNANSLTFKNGTPTLTGGALNISGAGGSVSVTTTTSTINSLLVGTTGLTKSNSGTLNLTNTGNTYTGVTTISGGILNVAALAVEGAGGGTASSLGSAGNAAANLVINGGTLQYTNNSGGTTDRSFTVGTSGATLDASGPGGGLSFNSSTLAIAFSSSASPATITLTGTNAGSIAAVIGNSGTGTNLTSIGKTGIGAWTLSGANTYSGVTSVTNGTLNFTTAAIEGSGGGAASALGAAGNAAAKLVINSGTLQFSGTTSQTTDRSFTIGASGATLSTSSTPGTSITFNSATPAIAFSPAGAPAMLTLTGQPNTAGTLGAALGNNGAAVVSLVKNGLGTWTLSGADSYTGSTMVNLGTLNVTGSIANTAVTINNGGTLGGSGTVGTVTINSGGTLSPGTSPGPITLGATTYNDGGAYRWEISDWTGAQGVGYDFQNTTGTLTIAATPGTFPANTFKIDIVGLSGGSPGSIANFDAAHTRSWTIAEASAGISGFAANKFTIDTSHIVDNLAGGGFSLSTANGAGSVQDLVLKFTPGTQQAAVIGQVTAVPSSGSIITGGSLPFSITVQNAGPAGAADLHFSAAAGTNVSGSVPGPVTVPAGNTSAPQPGLSFTGTAIGPSQPGSFSVSEASASNSPQGGSITVNVFDHASAGGFNGGTIALPSLIVGYSGPVAGTSSFSVPNGSAADYRVNLKATGGTAGSVTVSGFSGIAPGASGSISASLAAGRAAGPINQVIAVTLADDSSLSGANANLSTKNVTVTGNIFAHATPSDDSGTPGSFAGDMLDLGNIHVGYTSAVTSLGSITVFNGTIGDNRVPLSGSGAPSGGSTAGLSLNSLGGGGALVPGGSAQMAATLAPGLPTGAINQDFTYTFADDSALSGASANVGTATITVVGNVYSGQSIWRGRQPFGGMQPLGSTSDLWGTFSNWAGGSPGLDPSFAASDSATFGAQSGNVSVDLAGVSPRLVAMTFNHTGSYTIVDSTGIGSITLAGPAPTIAVAGTHSIAVPLSLAATTSITVGDPGDSLTISGAISGTGASLSKLGNGTLTLAHTNSFSGGTTVSAGTLRTTANIALGGGPLAVNATTGVNSVANLGGNETVSRLSGAASGNGSAAVSVAAGKTLIVSQATTSGFAGTVALAGAGATLTKTGSGTLEIDRGPNLAGGSILNVAAGTLRFNVATGSATIGSGATASIAPNAILELAGSVSALSDAGAATHRADITNSGNLSIGNTSVAASTSQQVGGIDGAGKVLINDGATLTANHIIQSSLVIGDGATTVIAASDANGQPLAADASIAPQTAEGFGAALAGLPTLENNAPLESPAFSPVSFENTAPLPTITPICVVAEIHPVAAVPEPSAWLLAASAAALLVAAGRRQFASQVSSLRK